MKSTAHVSKLFDPRKMSVVFLACCEMLLGSSASQADSRYVSFSESSVKRCTIAHIRKPTLNICLAGQSTGPDFERAKAWAARASLTWLRVLKVIDQSVTRQIAFTCNQKHLTINLRPGGGTSFASPSVSTIYSTRPYGTWTHELGHALAGLGDTYAGGAGKCGSQPQSLMCWGAYGPRANPDQWSTLWSDDIKGIQANFQKVFPGASIAPAWAQSVDLEKPVDPIDPWPSDAVIEPKVQDHQVQLVKGEASEIDYSEDTDSIDL